MGESKETKQMKKYLNGKSALVPTVAVLGSTMAGAFADASVITDAVETIATDAGTGVGAGILIGVVVFGARVVWRAVKSMAH